MKTKCQFKGCTKPAKWLQGGDSSFKKYCTKHRDVVVEKSKTTSNLSLLEDIIQSARKEYKDFFLTCYMRNGSTISGVVAKQGKGWVALHDCKGPDTPDIYVNEAQIVSATASLDC